MASRTRRSAFAAPFVVVLGCGKPAPRTLTAEQIANAPLPIDAALPTDAYVDTAPDADLAYEQAVRQAHCSGQLKPVWNCNPPPPADASMATGNPPAALVLRVINVNVTASGVEVIFNKGGSAGLASGMKGYLVDDGKKVPGSDFVLTQVSDRASRATLKLTVDQIEASPKAVLKLD